MTTNALGTECTSIVREQPESTSEQQLPETRRTDTLLEATELTRIRSNYSRVSSARLPNASIVPQGPPKGLARVDHAIRSFWKHQISVTVDHAACRDHLGKFKSLSPSISLSFCMLLHYVMSDLCRVHCMGRRSVTSVWHLLQPALRASNLPASVSNPGGVSTVISRVGARIDQTLLCFRAFRPRAILTTQIAPAAEFQRHQIHLS